MSGALLYLQVTSLRNAVWRRVRRLRQPRYLIASLVGAAYFYFFFFRGAWRHAGGPGPAAGNTRSRSREKPANRKRPSPPLPWRFCSQAA